MTIYSLGSINADHIYRVTHLPQPGETLSTDDFSIGLGGKGTNQSIAAAKAGSKVIHIGAIGPDGVWAKQKIASQGIDVTYINTVDALTGHAVINVDRQGENTIIIFSGANNHQDIGQIKAALSGAKKGDILLLQNETNLQLETARIAISLGMKTIYSAAPFSIDAVEKMLPVTTILMMNKVEFEQFCSGLETKISDLPVNDIIVTKGSDGVDWKSTDNGQITHVPSIPVTAVDTTAAGDTFAGYFAAGLEQGLDIKAAMQLASSAAALKVTRSGTADAIPIREEVIAFGNTV